MIYLDNAATTKPNEFAIKSAEKFLNNDFYNPSALYQGGLNCAKEIRKAKETMLNCMGALNHEVIFTSCGSESDNTAIFCAVKRGVFLTSEGEHAAVYKSFLELKNRGVQTEFIPLNSDGSVNVERLFDYVKDNPVSFISIVHVNNETGAINDVNYIAKTVKSINKNLVFHVDGVQAFGKIPYRLSNDIDLYSISAHKINAIKGVGALIKKKSVHVSPLIFGGGQENGLRSGTENVFGIKVFEYATKMHYKTLKEDFERAKELKRFLIDNLNKDYFKVISSDNASPYVISVSAKGLRGEVIMHSLELKGIIVGNGSACSSKNRYSRVLTACGYSNDVLDGVVRISISNETTLEEIKTAVLELNNTVIELKRIMK